MNFLKKPYVAVIIAVLAVIGSTLLSVDIRFGRSCREISDGFYDGIGNKKSIAYQLNNYCSAADGLVTVARSAGIDADNVSELCYVLSEDIGSASVSVIYADYSALRSALTELMHTMDSSSTVDKSTEMYKTYTGDLMSIPGVIDDAGYNESVRAFIRDKYHFPLNILAPIVGAELPEIFG